MGCSTGGRQGLAEVQRNLNDFHGVITGALGKSEDTLERIVSPGVRFTDSSGELVALANPKVVAA